MQRPRGTWDGQGPTPSARVEIGFGDECHRLAGLGQRSTAVAELLAIATLVLAVATVLLVGGVLVAWFSSREERNASQMQVAAAIFAEHRSREMRAARARIHEFPPCDPRLGLEQLTGEDREAAELVSHFLDSVGVLISRHYLASDAIDAFLGGSALGMWRDLEPYIRAERTVNRGRRIKRTSKVWRHGSKPLSSQLGRRS